MATSGTSRASQEEVKKWVVIYPVYLNSTKTLAQGRKISKTFAVENPTLAEITSSLGKLGLLYKQEPDKAYSRDPVVEIGRVRVQLKLASGLANPDIPDRMTLYKKVAEIIPSLNSRQQASSSSAKKPGKGKPKK